MIYIVMKNWKVDKVFDLWHPTVKYVEELRKRWNVVEVIEREIEE